MTDLMVTMQKINTVKRPGYQPTIMGTKELIEWLQRHTEIAEITLEFRTIPAVYEAEAKRQTARARTIAKGINGTLGEIKNPTMGTYQMTLTR